MFHGLLKNMFSRITRLENDVFNSLAVDYLNVFNYIVLSKI